MSDTPPLHPHAVEATSVSGGYGRARVLADLDFTVHRGEFVGLVGPSGAGKTTLLRLLTGRADLHGGTLQVLQQSVRFGRPPRGVGYVPQLATIDWDFPLTVREVVLLGDTAASRWVPWFSRRERTTADALLERLGITHVADHPISDLSGGQRQRMFLARSLLRRCDLLLLDEPTSGVDLTTRAEMLRLLGELHHEGLTVVLTTHDLNFVAAHLPRILCVNGTITADGRPAEVLREDVLTRTYGPGLRVIHDGTRPVVTDAEAIPLHSATDHARGVT